MRITATLLTIAAVLVGSIQSIFLEIDLSAHPEQANAVHEMNVNDAVSIKLAENPTTGYSWVLGNRPQDPVLRFAKKQYFPHKSQDEIFGAGGEAYYDFVAKKSGADTVDFVYCQVWAMDKFLDKETGNFDW
jgi:inhibitor of cysteine peptidase